MKELAYIISYEDLTDENGNIDYELWDSLKEEKETVICISKHAMQRLKERCNWNKKTSLRMLEKVYSEGKRVGEDDIPLYYKKWVTRRAILRDGIYIVYGNILYIFDNNTLITVIDIPSKSRFTYKERFSVEEKELDAMINEIQMRA